LAHAFFPFDAMKILCEAMKWNKNAHCSIQVLKLVSPTKWMELTCRVNGESLQLLWHCWLPS